jgi:phosphoenolpyruvate synthase/pyruvate phosphate dikinase
MPANQFIISLRSRKIPASVGNKALSLRRLWEKGIRIPITYVCDWRAYDQYLKNDPSLEITLREELSHIIDPQKAYAVRSSANLEDSLDHSFAGQFSSILNTRGVDQILPAMWSIWSTATSTNVQAYLERHGITTHDFAMAVIIQEMVPAVAAGVALSRNPVTEADEIVLEAVCGTGDALVQNGVTPCRWINRWGNWVTKPEQGVIPLELAEQLVIQTQKIAANMRAPIDLEWAWDGKSIYWLQVRPITTLHHRNVYSNQMSKEMLPGMIKPLIWSVNIPLKSRVMLRFFYELLGDTGINPEELTKSFYYRVYFNMGVIGQVFRKVGLPADSLEMMSGLNPMGSKMFKPTPQMFARLPRMASFAHAQWQFHKKLPKRLPDLNQKIKSIPWQEAEKLSTTDLFDATDQLTQLMQEITYYNILCPILSVMHHRMLSNELKRLGVDISQFDVTEGMPEITEFDPAIHLRRLHMLFEQFDPAVQSRIRATNYSDLRQIEGTEKLREGVAAFIARFGHLSDNGNDFSCTPWRENPDMVLKLIIDFQPKQAEENKKTRFRDLKVRPLRRRMIKVVLERVRGYRLLREQLSAQYTHTYGLFRYFYLAMAKYLVEGNIIDNPSDVFYLTDSEVRQWLNRQVTTMDYREEVARHKADMEKCQDIALPSIIYGDEEPPVFDQSSERLMGVATSLGHYTGPAKVVKGIADFGKVQRGDVLVIPYSDVGWAPLFALAGALVSESGGLLSHSSIIAREYGIPAVVSVNGAMNLNDNCIVTVDGHKGEVILHPNSVA